MKKIMFFVVLAFVVTLANSAFAAEWKWQHFGAAPYATSYEVAMTMRADAFLRLGISEQAIPFLIEETRKSPERIRIINGDRFEAMISKGGIVHHDVIVAFSKPPISGHMEYAAPASMWRMVWEGKIYTIVLPDVCHNWSVRMPTPTVVPSSPNCVELHFNAPVGGKVRWGIASNRGPMPPSECNAQRQGDDGPWEAWYGQCDDCVGALDYLRGILGSTAQIYHKYLYAVTETHQTLRFSEAVWENVVYICLEYPDGRRTCGVYMRPEDWNGQYVVFIPDRFWRSDANCPQ